MQKGILLLLGVLLFFQAVKADIVINEVMADPIADESLNEWIELYNNGDSEVNVSGWIVGDKNDNDTIEGGLYFGEGTVINSKGYAIITDDSTRVYDNFDCSEEALRLYSNSSTKELRGPTPESCYGYVSMQ